ncbi:RIP metalloprotease RseP [Kaistella jeonii]|uniref:Zinc metalloprotease n=1 Tax=Kaistella jeonii TaxID=266749 RepID=A0A0C1D669_9FLAO|nr:RIP metalloprotease RseP [Kaistella jeonii]KIA89315.1 zinc metalloprotease [Kaistella jeonii]SFC02643.1 regulator of sigma E protease [Kaistella jeonii]VEI96633.1 Regulator of sigma E protease [Kaistella jeonii]
MTLIQLFQFILSISILVILHELGHFIPAKLFKTKVEKFYLFFDPWFSIAKKKIGDTEYGIGWLPFGGYVKIAGMVDESMDTEQLKQPAQPWEFRSKPAWQRLIIMMGGVTVNFFLAWLIYSSLSYFKGETYHDLAKFENGIAVSDAGKKMGLQSGDKILKIDGKPAERMETSTINMLFANQVTVLRGGNEITFPVNEDGVAAVLAENEAKLYFSPRFPVVIDSLTPTGSAKSAGLLKGDKIVGVNGKPVQFFDELVIELSQHKNQNVVLDIERNNAPQKTDIKVDDKGKLGFTTDTGIAQKEFEKTQVTKQYSFLGAIPRGLTRTIDVLTMQIKQFKIVFNTKTQGYKKVSGPIGIIKQMPKEINWEFFWSFTAMFSVWLAFLNLIPIPGLDGGHVVFTLWEMITGKPVPQKVLENAQMIGVIFLLGLMVVIFGNDILKWITGKF